jgi:beta-lactamase class D
MKEIQPISIWVTGTTKIAEYLQVTGINDNYDNSATNYWQLFTKITDAEDVESAGEQIAQGNLTISGQDYINWGDQPAMNINAWIYNWVANQINVVII